jgi:nucleotide-binding universal stress UspA family protein
MSAQEGTGMTAIDGPKLERVVIGIDFSAPSVAAARWTREHFAPQASCVLVHALDVPKPPRFMRGEVATTTRAEMLKSARAGAEAQLERFLSGQNGDGLGVDVRDGRPENVITEAASESRADVVVVGEHLHPRGIWGVLGSTAEALVRRGAIPVVLARNAPDHAPARILVAVDDSNPAGLALQWACMLAQRFDAALTAFHVFRPIYLGAARVLSGMEHSVRLEEDQLRQTEAWLATFVREQSPDPSRVSVRIEHGDPAAALVAAQRGGDFDMVVIGSRGAGGVGRMLLGSVARSVMRGASCPVLVVSAHDDHA